MANCKDERVRGCEWAYGWTPALLWFSPLLLMRSSETPTRLSSPKELGPTLT